MTAGSYQQINLSANLTLVWAFSGEDGTVLMDNNVVIPTTGGFKIIMPNATLGAEGSYFVFYNSSIYSYSIYKADGTTLIISILAGENYQILLKDISTTNGTWNATLFGGGTNALTFLELESTNSSITITDGIQTPPGGTVNLVLPVSLSNLNAVGTAGFPVITATAPLTWRVATLVAGTNISITNPTGVSANPIFNLSSTLTGLTSAVIGSMTFSTALIANNNTNGGVQITTNGSGTANINGVTIDTSGNITGVNNLTVNGTLNKAIRSNFYFTDIISGMSNTITVTNYTATITITGTNGTYRCTFGTAQATAGYNPMFSIGSTGGSTPLITHAYCILRTTTYFDMIVTDASGVLVTSVPNGIGVTVI